MSARITGVRDLVVALDRRLAIDHNHDRPPSRIAYDLAGDLDRVLKRNPALARDLDRALDLAGDPDLNRALTYHRNRARDLDRALHRAPDRNRALTYDRNLPLTDDLNLALTRAAVLVSALNHFGLDRAAAGIFGRSRAQREAGRVAYPAARLLAGAARLLPAADRARYAEEYRSELWELARAGTAGPGQLGYALRQLRSAPRTGRALRALRRRGAAP